MKSADMWFSEYDEFHRHPTNKMLHAICIPLIMFSIVGLLWMIPVPAWFPSGCNVATLSALFTLAYYCRLSPSLAVAMLVIYALMLSGAFWLQQTVPGQVVALSLAVFFAGWIGQFVGHKIEGKKPAFFDDVRFLLIGPLWLVGFLYRRWGIRY